MMSRRLALMLLSLAGAARPVAAQVIDSLLPIEEEVRRFEATLTEHPTALRGGASTRDQLVRDFVRAIETRDTARLADMLIRKAEFARLYYPSSRYTRPPYRQKPSLVWFMMSNRSGRGIGRVLARDGGAAIGFRGYRCASKPLVEGRNRIWRDCELDLGGGRTRRLFGAILERDRRFKFLTYDSEY